MGVIQSGKHTVLHIFIPFLYGWQFSICYKPQLRTYRLWISELTQQSWTQDKPGTVVYGCWYQIYISSPVGRLNLGVTKTMKRAGSVEAASPCRVRRPPALLFGPIINTMLGNARRGGVWLTSGCPLAIHHCSFAQERTGPSAGPRGGQETRAVTRQNTCAFKNNNALLWHSLPAFRASSDE